MRELEPCPLPSPTPTCPMLSSLLSGFVESELKKLLVVQRESRLWKTDSPEGWELLAQPEVTLEEAGIVASQVFGPPEPPAR